MDVQITAGSAIANALQNVIGPKLVEAGWSTDGQGDSLTEYIILMLENRKSQDEIARDLANDLLDLGPEDQSAVEFARWLFEQIEIVSQQIKAQDAPSHPIPTGPAADMQSHQSTASPSGDMDVDGQEKKIPSGPKAMRNGTPGNGRGGNRMFNQMNRHMDRSADPLHRIQGGGAGVGRVSGRGNMKNTRGSHLQRNMEGMNRRAMQNAAMNPMAQNFQMPQGNMPAAQTQFLQVMEQHAQMMAQMAAQAGFAMPMMNQNGGMANGHQNKFDRPRGNRQNWNRQPRQRQDEDTAMGEDATGEAQPAKDAAHTLCKFNLHCTKSDCQFAHQSPAAPEGYPVDFDTECSFGAACKNAKCSSRHPSPAKKAEHQSQTDCLYGPQCQNPNCRFKHSNAPMCRNGGDCTTEGCTFFHSPIECRYNPCTNTRCFYKHKEGQKRGAGANVWTAGGEREHLSERRFVNDAEEEVIIPGASNSEMNVEAEVSVPGA